MAAERNDRSRPYYAVTSSQPSGITTVHESVLVKVFGCRPHEGGAADSGAGVRKPPKEETAGRDTSDGAACAIED
jgi:hypothetical protein